MRSKYCSELNIYLVHDSVHLELAVFARSFLFHLWTFSKCKILCTRRKMYPFSSQVSNGAYTIHVRHPIICVVAGILCRIFPIMFQNLKKIKHKFAVFVTVYCVKIWCFVKELGVFFVFCSISTTVTRALLSSCILCC